MFDFGGFGHAFGVAGAQDWSGYTSFDFWFYGTGSGLTYQAEISDNRSNPNADTSERFDYEFTDAVAGWQYISIPFADFTRATDFQPGGAPDDGVTLTEIWAWAIVAFSVMMIYIVTMENGALLGSMAQTVHEFFHDGRHIAAVPCH